jgi:hypothetical protein
LNIAYYAPQMPIRTMGIELSSIEQASCIKGLATNPLKIDNPLPKHSRGLGAISALKTPL